MAVMAELAGKSEVPQTDMYDRQFMEIDIDNFDDRMKSIKPRVALQVDNTLTGDGILNIDMTFESMDDFNPANVARKIEPLAELLEARTELANLLTYMDGKTGAEELINKALQNPALLKSVATTPKPSADSAAEDDN